MIVSKLGVKVGNTVLYSLDKTEIELLNGVIGDLVVNANDSKSILVNIISYVLSGGFLSDDLMQKLHLIERLSNSVGYELDLVIEDVVTRKVNEIKFNGIYIRRVSDCEIVYFIPYKFYEMYAKVFYSLDESKRDNEVVKRMDLFFSPPTNSNIKTLTSKEVYELHNFYNFEKNSVNFESCLDELYGREGFKLYDKLQPEVVYDYFDLYTGSVYSDGFYFGSGNGSKHTEYTGDYELLFV